MTFSNWNCVLVCLLGTFALFVSVGGGGYHNFVILRMF